MEVKGFSFYITYYDVAKELSTPEEQGEFYRAIVDYMFANVDREEELSWHVRVCFKAIKANLKTSKRRSQAADKSNAKQAQNKRKADANEAQNERKGATAKQAQDKVQVQDKDKGQVQDDDGNHSHGSQSSSSYAAVACGDNAAPTPYDGKESVVFPCPYCHADTVGEWNESVGKYSVNCGGCGGSYVMSAAAVELAIGKGGAA